MPLIMESGNYPTTKRSKWKMTRETNKISSERAENKTEKKTYKERDKYKSSSLLLFKKKNSTFFLKVVEKIYLMNFFKAYFRKK